MAWFITLLIGLAINVVAYLIMPKPKQPKPPEVKDMESPTNSSGSPIPVMWGCNRVKGLNILHTANKFTYKRRYEERGGKK